MSGTSRSSSCAKSRRERLDHTVSEQGRIIDFPIAATIGDDLVSRAFEVPALLREHHVFTAPLLILVMHKNNFHRS
jgi:hypothetical protein